MKRQSRKTRTADESPTRVRTTRSSPARSPGRPRKNVKSSKSKSPSRKSPSRKSPSRKSPSRAEALPLRSPPTNKAKQSAVDAMDITTSKAIVKVVKLTKNEYETKNGVESNDIHSRLRERRPKLEYCLPSKSARTRDIENYEQLLKIAHSTELPKSEVSNDKIDNDMSEDDAPYALPKARLLITPVKELRSRGPKSGKLLHVASLIFETIFAFCSILACSGQMCNFTTMPDLTPYSKIGAWFTLRSLWLTLGYVATIFLASFFPYFGKKAILPGSKRTYKANGFFLFAVIFTVTFAIEKYITSIADIVYEDYVQLCLLWIITSFVFSVAMFVIGKNTTEENRNHRADGENKLYDFCVGRQISPFAGKINFKICFFRIGLISMTLFNFIWLYYSLKIGDLPVLTTESLMNLETYVHLIRAFQINKTLVVFAFMEIFYGLIFLYFEEDSSWMYEFTSEGVGFYFIFGYFFYPFCSPMITKLIIDQNIQLPYQLLTFVLIMYLIGCYINFASNCEKNLFRKNPLHPKVAHLQTMPTLTGSRLITSGWWGMVRHPNYLGDIISQSMFIFVSYNNLTIFFIIFEVLNLAKRTIRDGKRCSEHYGVAWKRYCQKVPYALIPKVW